MITDPVANYLTSIRNAIQARHRTVSVRQSHLCREITRILVAQGYIHDYKVEEAPAPQGSIHITLKYDPRTKQSPIHKIARVSKPSLRKYSKAADLSHVLNGLGIAIISTSQGVMTDKEARQKRVGGEVLCYIH